ncbi:putative L-asparaginase [Campylobacter jejuni subsp. doylei 269.97]|uniref:Isoaspartyl peptidase n=2 Tax=Campylobacter jejuni subsp. doylei TaxID=32021 RepID=A7H5G5_CAMJD|nr:putative L-asparaginase [Campylobacter jejuni subsp. doylei 269.97]AVL47975.1 isoaspartyl peptidase/L-asparaginase [Campylobacter jejuni subsp. doylei]
MKILNIGAKAFFLMASLGCLNTALVAKDIKPIIVIHGGTSGLGLSKEEFAKREVVMKQSLKAGQKILEQGGSATDAVIATIKVMEDSEEFNAGKGAVFTADGFNELDASLMEGKGKKAGAIAMARTIKNPIEAARVVMEKTPHTLIAGEGADKLAKENELEIVSQKYFYTPHRYKQLEDAKKSKEILLDSDKAKAHLGNYTEPYLGTVGAIALDKEGNLAAGTSTGGTTNKMTGRIGDSPIIGAGNYADNDSVAISCTGTGDIFIRSIAAYKVSALYKYKKLSVQKAAEQSIDEVAKLGGTGGIISIDKNGNVGYAWTKDKLGMYHGEARVGQEPRVFFPVAK